MFKIRSEERWLTLVSAIVFGVLNTLTVVRYYGSFSQLTDHYHKLFVSTFHISGFDPLTYAVLSNWETAYNVYRHPLLAFFMFPFNQINQGLMQLTGMNWATIITAVILTACSSVSFVLLFRILREIVGVTVRQAYLLSAMCFSFSFVMLSTMVPDHFIMSMMLLLLTLYMASPIPSRGGECGFNIKKTVVLFFFTAGVSLNNGLKVFLSALFVRRKKFFKPRYLLCAVLLPAALMWGFARWEYRTFVWPTEMKRAEIKRQKDKAETQKLREYIADSLRKANIPLVTHDDSLRLNAALKKEKQARAEAKYREDHKKIWNRNTGKPIAKGEFSRWTDITTPRWDTVVENLFGEGILLHEDYLLGDVLRDRPVIVRYRNCVNYVVEGMIVLLFLFGLWKGRRSWFMWMVMSYFMMDMVLHVGLGFGINEIYIMSPHYLFAIPIAIGYGLKPQTSFRRMDGVLTIVVALVTLYCWLWNGYYIFDCMLS